MYTFIFGRRKIPGAERVSRFGHIFMRRTKRIGLSANLNSRLVRVQTTVSVVSVISVVKKNNEHIT